MTKKKNNFKSSGTALVWAALMIAVALVVDDAEKSGILILFLVAGWVATGGLSGGRNEFAKAECRAFRRWIGAAPKAEK